MPSPFRQGSFLDRLTRTFNASGDNPIPTPFIGALSGYIGLQHGFKPLESLDAYGDNPWLYASVNVIAQEVSRIKLTLNKRNADGTSERIFDHQALSTLNKPMPTDQGRSILTHMQLKYLLAQHIMLNGEGFWLMDGRLRAGNSPTEIYPLMPGFVIEKLDQNYRIEKYYYRATGTQVEIDPLDVVHFKLVDPKNWYRGHSPVQSIRYAIDSHKEADILNYNRFANGAMPGGVIETTQAVNEQERQRILDQFAQKYAGSKNASKTAMLPYGLKFSKTQDSNAEMQYVQLKEHARDEILANMRVGLEMLGKTEGQTRANADAANYVFQRFTILPLIELITDVLTNDFLPSFPEVEDLYFGFDEFVPEDIDSKRNTVQTLTNIGALTPNEARAGFGLDELDIPEADTPHINFNLTPLQPVTQSVDDDIEADLEGDDADEEDEDEQEGRQRRAKDELPTSTSNFFDRRKETAALAAIALPFLLRGFRKGIDIANEAGTPVEPNDILSANVRAAIEARNLDLAAKAVQTTEDQLRDTLLQAHEDGIGTQELASRINDLYDGSMGYRSLRIARTELTGSINDGTVQTLDQQGYTQKTWSTVLDGHERDSHAEANGQTVSIDQPFQLAGGQGMYPGDSSLPTSEVINCRCVVVGSGTPEDRQSHINDIFLRVHGSLEREFKSAVMKHFQEQRDRILAHFPTR